MAITLLFGPFLRSSSSRNRRPLAALAVALAILALLVPLAQVRAATLAFTVVQEQAILGTATGSGGVQAEDAAREILREADAVPDPMTYPGSETIAIGTSISGTFPGSITATDTVYRQYREASTSPDTVVQNNPGGTGVVCAWTNCVNGEASDNLYATSNTSLQDATYRSFGLTLPVGATIIRVEVGVEAFRPTGDDLISVTPSWDGGTTYCSNPRTVGPPMTDPDNYTYLDFTTCTGHSWARPDFNGNNLATKITYNQVPPTPDVIDLDANVVRVTYNVFAYQLDVRYGFAGVPAGQAYTLMVRAAINSENVDLQVFSPPAAWNTRATFTSAAAQVIFYNLTAAEYSAGSPIIRFIDALGGDLTQSDFWVDEARITTVVVGYGLDVRQNITGVTGPNPILVVKGNVSVGGENFDVSVWNFSAGAWDLVLNSAFTSANAFHNSTLSPSEVGSGTVRIRYTDANPTDIVPGYLTLDYVAVATGGPQALPDLALALADVVLSKPNPSKGDPVTINVTVSNIGAGDAADVLVQFAAGGQVVATQSAGAIAAGGKKQVSFAWTVGDSKDLTFTVDPLDTIRESNETNNQVALHVGPTGPDPVVLALIGGSVAAALLFLFFFLLPRRRRSSGTPPRQGWGIIGGFLTKPRGSPLPPRAKAPSLDLVPGHTYLVEEEKRAQSLKIFEDMLKKGKRGLLITRMNPKAVQADGALQGVRSYWLADIRGHGSTEGLVLTASLESILFTVQEFLQENPEALVLLDGVEFLVDNNNFNAVLRFLRRLVDLISQGNHIMLVSVSPGTLQERELKNLEREMDVLRLA